MLWGLCSQSWWCCWFGPTEAPGKVADTGWPLLNQKPVKQIPDKLNLLSVLFAHLGSAFMIHSCCRFSHNEHSQKMWEFSGRAKKFLPQDAWQNAKHLASTVAERALLLVWILRRTRFLNHGEKEARGALGKGKNQKSVEAFAAFSGQTLPGSLPYH